MRRTAGRVLRLIRNLSLTASVLRAQWSEDGYVVGARILRALPRRVRTTVERAGGAPGELARALRDGAVGAGAVSGSRARRRVRVGLAVHDVVGARRAWDAAPLADAVLEARLVAAEGDPDRGERLLADVRGRRAGVVRRLLAGEAALLHPVDDSEYRAGPSWTGAGPIVHVVTNALPEMQAGYTVRTQGIARAQVRTGAEVVVVPRLGFPVLVGALGAADEVEVDGVRSVRHLPWRLPSRVDDRLDREVDALEAFVRTRRPRVLHAHSSYLNARVALRVRARTGVPVVYEVRGFLEETWRSRGGAAESPRFSLARASETQAMLAADQVVTISEGMAEEIRGRGVPADRVRVVPNSVDDSFLGPAEAGAEVRAGLGVGDDDVVVGIVTTLNAYEGVDVLIDAVARLAADGWPVHLVVVGDGPERATLAARAERLLGDRAHVIGRVPYNRVRRWFAAVDLFCVPRLDLPVTARVTPIKPLEAMATGRPVVASDLAPLREIVRDGETGWFARPGDPNDLATVLARALADPEELRRRGGLAHEWVGAERTWARAAEAYSEVYSRAVRGPGVVGGGRPL